MYYTGKKKTDKLGNKHCMTRQKKQRKKNQGDPELELTQNRHTIEFLNIYTNTLA